MAAVKSLADQAKLRVAGRIAGEILQAAYDRSLPGVTGTELDRYVAGRMAEAGCTASFLGYEGYPKSCCLSVNDQVVHGIPGEAPLREGDTVSIDLGLWYQGVCVDTAVTKRLGPPDPEVERLIRTCKESLRAGIRAIRPYRRIGSISAAVQAVAEKEGLGIVRALVGHGVGHAVHESPEVPNYGRIGDGALLKPGMVLAIEPMLTLGGGDVETEVDGWGIVTADGSTAAHFEHTVLVTAKGAEILTPCPANAGRS